MTEAEVKGLIAERVEGVRKDLEKKITSSHKELDSDVESNRRKFDSKVESNRKELEGKIETARKEARTGAASSRNQALGVFAGAGILLSILAFFGVNGMIHSAADRKTEQLVEDSALPKLMKELNGHLETAKASAEAASGIKGELDVIKGDLTKDILTLRERMVPPIGAIVASVIPYDAMPKSFRECWVPADGRASEAIQNSQFAKQVRDADPEIMSELTKNEKISEPNLTGVFLRGLNTFEPSAGEGGELRDPDGANRTPGHLQPDQFREHKHEYFRPYAEHAPNRQLVEKYKAPSSRKIWCSL